MTQQNNITDIVSPKIEEIFKRQRALAQYIGESCRPYSCATVQLTAALNAKIEEAQLISLRWPISHKKKQEVR